MTSPTARELLLDYFTDLIVERILAEDAAATQAAAAPVAEPRGEAQNPAACVQ